MAVKSAGICTGCSLWNDDCQETDMRRPGHQHVSDTESSTTPRASVVLANVKDNYAASMPSTTKASESMPEWAHAAVATPPTASLVRYDCESGFDNCLYSWTIAKKEWCTTNSQRVCPLYDCNNGFHDCGTQWSDEQKTWCQQNRVDRQCVVLKK